MDHFYLEKIFPEPSKLFEFEFKDLEGISQNCIYVFDTNILLIPFLVSNKGFKNYKKITSDLVKNNRLVIPARVAREFAKNRGESIKALFRKLQEARDRLDKGSFDVGSLPVFEEDVNYKRIKSIESEVKKLRNEYRESIDLLSGQIRNWNWNDPVSTFYKKIWNNDSIVEMKRAPKDIQADLKFRHEHQIAPGYKDKNNIDGGIGDLIIWQTIMEISKDRKSDIVFVTNDGKSDWFYNENKTSLYPKFELFDEFRRFTDGHSVSIINFEQFLISQKASKDTIQEVIDLRPPLEFPNKSFNMNYFNNGTLITAEDGQLLLTLACGYGQPVTTTVYLKKTGGVTDKIAAFSGDTSDLDIGNIAAFRFNRVIVYSTIHDIRDVNPGQEVEDIHLEIKLSVGNAAVSTSFLKKTKGAGTLVNCTYEVIIL